MVAVEALGAAQAVEFHLPYHTSLPLQQVVAKIRTLVPSYTEDRFFAPDIEAAETLIQSGYFFGLVADILPSGDL